MPDKKIIAVIGATGAQGGGLVRSIAADRSGAFAARAITRKPDSESAKALAGLGVEVVAADLDDEASLRRAFEGAHGVFCVTNFWEHSSPERELAQTSSAARAAKGAGVSHVVWSTLEDTRLQVPLSDSRLPTLKEKYKVPHFDAKGEADAVFAALSVPTTYLLAAFYWENFIGFGMGPEKGRTERSFSLSRSGADGCRASPRKTSGGARMACSGAERKCWGGESASRERSSRARRWRRGSRARWDRRWISTTCRSTRSALWVFPAPTISGTCFSFRRSSTTSSAAAGTSCSRARSTRSSRASGPGSSATVRRFPCSESTGRPRATPRRSRVLRPIAENAGREKKKRAKKGEHSLDGDAGNSERQEEKPDDRIEHEREQGDRPTQEKEQQPEKELHGE